MSFSLWQGRWTYYANLAELFLVVRFYQLAPLRWPQLAVLAAFLLGLINVNYFEIKARLQSPPNQPSLQLLQVSNAIDAPGGVPRPVVAFAGTALFFRPADRDREFTLRHFRHRAGAQFYSATSWVEAERFSRRARCAGSWSRTIRL